MSWRHVRATMAMTIKGVQMKRILAFLPWVAALLLCAGQAMAVQSVEQASAATTVVLEGTVVMLIEDDFLKGRATTHHFLDDSATGKRHPLKLRPEHAGRVEPGM